MLICHLWPPAFGPRAWEGWRSTSRALGVGWVPARQSQSPGKASRLCDVGNGLLPFPNPHKPFCSCKNKRSITSAPHKTTPEPPMGASAAPAPSPRTGPRRWAFPPRATAAPRRSHPAGEERSGTQHRSVAPAGGQSHFQQHHRAPHGGPGMEEDRRVEEQSGKHPGGESPWETVLRFPVWG